ncbi:MAG: hypothetical protein JJD98_02745 [Polaromonas sp.]|nr:hypothetical protein [Polaromonas sp.]
MSTTKLIVGTAEGFRETIEMVSVKLGDVVILTMNGHLSTDQRERLMSCVNDVLPDGVKALVLDGGVKMAVLRV